MNPKTIFAVIFAVTAQLSAAPAWPSEEVNLYSYRQGFLIEPLLNAFTAETGIEVNLVYAKKGMVEKIKAAGANNPADAVLTVDVGRLHALEEAGLLAAVDSAVLRDNIPAKFRHPDNLWFGLTQRARAVYAHKGRVADGEIQSIRDLAHPRFRGRICVRSGKHVYNVGLIAALIAHDGEAATKKWLKGVKNNLARKPQGNDRAQAKGIYEGVCDVAIANHYYMVKMQTNQKKPEQQAWAGASRVIFLDQQGHGQHVNISGAGVLNTAKNRANAIRLLEFLAGKKAQHLYAVNNHEYPVREDIATSEAVNAMGRFRADSLSLAEMAANRKRASQLVDEVRFDEGPGT